MNRHAAPERKSRQLQTKVGEISAEAIKSILFYVHEDDGVEVRLQSAVALARACSANLHLFQVTPSAAYSMANVFAAGPIGEDIIAAVEEVTNKFRVRLEKRLQREQLGWSSEAIVGRVVPEILLRAALSDIIIMGREKAETEFSRSGPTLLSRLVSSISSPILIQGTGSQPLNPFGTVVIGWNGTFEAANAVRQSIALLRMASEVRVVRFAANEKGAISDERVLGYLSNHGIAPLLETVPLRGQVGEGLVDYAVSADAAYLVAGAFGHSRAGEFLFGGVTRHLLQECAVTLLVAH